MTVVWLCVLGFQRIRARPGRDLRNHSGADPQPGKDDPLQEQPATENSEDRQQLSHS